MKHPLLFAALLVALLLTLTPAPARADAASVFGSSARSAGLARASVAAADAPDAPRENAALAASPGARLRLGYQRASVGLTFNGADIGVADVGGVNLAAQLGVRLGSFTVGGAMTIHLPDQHLAAVAFRPASEPQFVLYEAPLQRTSVDLVGAVRWGAFALGGGLAMGLDVGGEGTSFTLGQDAAGTFTDARLDVALPYHFAPILGANVDLGRAAVGLSFRGPTAIKLGLDNAVRVELASNPLNGTTAVRVSGPAGYDPALVDLGARVSIGHGLALLAAVEYAAWHLAPPPVADVIIDVRLGTTPSQREARFVDPRFRDTLSPRLGVELQRPASGSQTRWALRAGWALAPSPVPRQTGFTTYADATRNVIALGGGYRFGRVWGVELAIDLAAQLHLLASRVEDKPNASLPYAHFEVGGRMVHGAATLEAAWR